MKKSMFATAAVSLAFSGMLMAQAAQNPATNPGSQKTAPAVKFSGLDTNKDGRVSKDEVKAHAELTTSFATLDSDRDTYLSETEFGKWHSSSSMDGTSPGHKMPPADADKSAAPTMPKSE